MQNILQGNVVAYIDILIWAGVKIFDPLATGENDLHGEVTFGLWSSSIRTVYATAANLGSLERLVCLEEAAGEIGCNIF